MSIVLNLDTPFWPPALLKIIRSWISTGDAPWYKELEFLYQHLQVDWPDLLTQFAALEQRYDTLADELEAGAYRRPPSQLTTEDREKDEELGRLESYLQKAQKGCLLLQWRRSRFLMRALNLDKSRVTSATEEQIKQVMRDLPSLPIMQTKEVQQCWHRFGVYIPSDTASEGDLTASTTSDWVSLVKHKLLKPVVGLGGGGNRLTVGWDVEEGQRSGGGRITL